MSVKTTTAATTITTTAIVVGKTGKMTAKFGTLLSPTGSVSSRTKNMVSQMRKRCEHLTKKMSSVEVVKLYLPLSGSESDKTKSREALAQAILEVFPTASESFVSDIDASKSTTGSDMLYAKVILKKDEPDPSTLDFGSLTVSAGEVAEEVVDPSILDLGSLPVSTGNLKSRVKHLTKQLQFKNIQSRIRDDTLRIELIVPVLDELTEVAVKQVLEDELHVLVPKNTGFAVTAFESNKLKVVVFFLTI